MADEPTPENTNYSTVIEKAIPGKGRFLSRKALIIGAVLVGFGLFMIIHGISQPVLKKKTSGQNVSDQQQSQITGPDENERAAIQVIRKIPTQRASVGKSIPDLSHPQNQAGSNGQQQTSPGNGGQHRLPGSPQSRSMNGYGWRPGSGGQAYGGQSPEDSPILAYDGQNASYGGAGGYPGSPPGTGYTPETNPYLSGLHHSSASAGTSSFGGSVSQPPPPPSPFPAGFPGATQGQPEIPSGAMPGQSGMSYGDTNDQKGKEKFLAQARKSDFNGYLKSTPKKRLSDFEIAAGSIIPAVMLTKLDTDLPGPVYARVTSNVFNDVPGHEGEILIPANSRLTGHYSSNVSMGQTRILVAWDEIQFPNKTTINLRGMEGLDSTGQAGFHDIVDNHYMRIFGAAIILSFFTAASEMSIPSNAGSALTAPSEASVAQGAVGQNMGMVGSQMIQNQMNIQSTLRVRPGYQCNVYVSKTMFFASAYHPDKTE